MGRLSTTECTYLPTSKPFVLRLVPEDTGKQLSRAVAKVITPKKKKTNWVEVLPAVVRAWHETTGPSGYTPNEIVFGKHNRTKGPPLAEPKGVAQDAAHYFQRREELIALARRAMIQV